MGRARARAREFVRWGAGPWTVRWVPHNPAKPEVVTRYVSLAELNGDEPELARWAFGIEWARGEERSWFGAPIGFDIRLIFGLGPEGLLGQWARR